MNGDVKSAGGEEWFDVVNERDEVIDSGDLAIAADGACSTAPRPIARRSSSGYCRVSGVQSSG